METIITALITGGLALVGTIISNKSTQTKIQQQLEIKLAIFNTRLEELTREVREHNNFAQRMPVVENEIKHLQTEVHQLEDFHK